MKTEGINNRNFNDYVYVMGFPYRLPNLILISIALTLTLAGVLLDRTFQGAQYIWPWVVGTCLLCSALIYPLFLPQVKQITMPLKIKRHLSNPWLWLVIATLLNGTVLLLGFNHYGATLAFGTEVFPLRSSLPGTLALMMFFALLHSQRPIHIQHSFQIIGALGLLFLNLFLIFQQPDLFIVPFILLLFFCAGHGIKGLLGRSLQLITILLTAAVVYSVISRSYVLNRLVRGWINPTEHAEGSGFYLTQSFAAIQQGGWFGGDLSNYGQSIHLPAQLDLFAFPLAGFWLGKISMMLIVAAIAAFIVILWQQRRNLGGVPRYVITAFIGLFVYNHIFAIGAPLGLVPFIGSSYGVAFLSGSEFGFISFLMVCFAAVYQPKQNILPLCQDS